MSENKHNCTAVKNEHTQQMYTIDCFEKEVGVLFIELGEYSGQVNFCPMCGYESTSKTSFISDEKLT